MQLEADHADESSISHLDQRIIEHSQIASDLLLRAEYMRQLVNLDLRSWGK